MDKNKPPGPKESFLLGSLPELSKDLNQFMLNLSKEYPDISQFNLASQKCFLVSNPDYLKSVLVTNNNSYIKDRFFWRHTKPLLGKSLLTESGEEWKYRRKLSAPAFQHKSMSKYISEMKKITMEWLETCEDNQSLDIHQAMADLTGKIAVKTLFGSELQGTGEIISQAIKDTTDVVYERLRQVISLPFFIPTPNNLKYMRGVKKLDELVFQFIKEHREGLNEGGTLLSALMSATNDDGKQFTDQQLRNEAITLFLAGHETTALSLTWAWYLLSQNPEVERKLYNELNNVLGGKLPSLEDLPNLPYARAVIKESLRIYPPAYTFAREAIEDNQVGPYSIPKGSVVFISTWALNRNELYFPEPEKFDPERWTPEFEKSLPKYAFIPFGGGPRVCIGEGFAMTEAMIILAMTAQRFSFSYNRDLPPTPHPAVTLRPLEGMPVISHKKDH
jgi:cytochrome P450